MMTSAVFVLQIANLVGTKMLPKLLKECCSGVVMLHLPKNAIEHEANLIIGI